MYHLDGKHRRERCPAMQLCSWEMGIASFARSFRFANFRTNKRLNYTFQPAPRKSRRLLALYLAPPSHEILCQTRLEKRSTELSDTEFEEVGSEAVAWWQVQNHEAAIKALTAPAPSSGLAQLMHLGALAYLGDFSTLMDYQGYSGRVSG